jgi:hypothetical protein
MLPVVVGGPGEGGGGGRGGGGRSQCVTQDSNTPWAACPTGCLDRLDCLYRLSKSPLL